MIDDALATQVRLPNSSEAPAAVVVVDRKQRAGDVLRRTALECTQYLICRNAYVL